MNIMELKEKAETLENSARELYINTIKLYLSKFKRKLHAADKLAGYSDLFENLENQKLLKLKLIFARILESKVLEKEEIL